MKLAVETASRDFTHQTGNGKLDMFSRIILLLLEMAFRWFFELLRVEIVRQLSHGRGLLCKLYKLEFFINILAVLWHSDQEKVIM